MVAAALLTFVLDSARAGVRAAAVDRRRHRAASTCCAGSGGASTRGARSPRWSSSFVVALRLLRRRDGRGTTVPSHISLLVTVAITTVVWVDDGVPDAADRSRDAGGVLPAGAPRRARMGAGPARGRAAAVARQPAAGAARLGAGLRVHLRGACSAPAACSTATIPRRSVWRVVFRGERRRRSCDSIAADLGRVAQERRMKAVRPRPRAAAPACDAPTRRPTLTDAQAAMRKRPQGDDPASAGRSWTTS